MNGFGKSGAMEQAHYWTSMNYRGATKCPPQYLVGKLIGLVRAARYAAKRGGASIFFLAVHKTSLAQTNRHRRG